jgi:hypothetical protein
MGNQCGATLSDPYHVNLCMLSYIFRVICIIGTHFLNGIDIENQGELLSHAAFQKRFEEFHLAGRDGFLCPHRQASLRGVHLPIGLSADQFHPLKRNRAAQEGFAKICFQTILAGEFHKLMPRGTTNPLVNRVATAKTPRALVQWA